MFDFWSSEMSLFYLQEVLSFWCKFTVFPLKWLRLAEGFRRGICVFRFVNHPGQDGRQDPDLDLGLDKLEFVKEESLVKVSGRRGRAADGFWVNISSIFCRCCSNPLPAALPHIMRGRLRLAAWFQIQQLVKTSFL